MQCPNTAPLPERGRISKRSSRFSNSVPEAGCRSCSVHPHDYLELASIAPRPLAPRLIYLSDVKDSLRVTGTDTVERGLIELAKLGPLHVRDYHQFVTRRPHFLALVTFHHGTWNWLFPQLRADGFAIKLRASRGDLQLYDVQALAGRGYEPRRTAARLERDAAARRRCNGVSRRSAGDRPAGAGSRCRGRAVPQSWSERTM